jgi:hypothetical protein
LLTWFTSIPAFEVIEEQERVREEQRRLEREAECERRRLERDAQRSAHYMAKKVANLLRRAKKKVRTKSTLSPVTRISLGKYAADGGYEIMHDDGEGGTGKWMVAQDPTTSSVSDPDVVLLLRASQRFCGPFVRLDQAELSAGGHEMP